VWPGAGQTKARGAEHRAFCLAGWACIIFAISPDRELQVSKEAPMKNSPVVTLGLCSLLTVFASLFSGCVINRRVIPAPVGTRINTVFIENNPAVLMNGMVGEIQSQIAAMGYGAKIYTGERPKEAVHYMQFNANWRWDMAMYLTYFHATLFEDGRVLGTAEYDARYGGANPAKFGHTAEKIGPILHELFQNAHPVKASAPPTGSNS
jgi:hypothetical protein